MNNVMQDMPAMMGSGGIIMWLVMAALIIVPFGFIFSKAGYSWWFGFLMVIPLLNVIMFYYLAFSTWPSQEDKY